MSGARFELTDACCARTGRCGHWSTWRVRRNTAADVSPWLRPDANACPDRAFCYTFGRGEGKHQMVPGWPSSIVAALETGRTSWTAVLDAVRLEPGADVAAMTTVQLREVVEQLVAVGQWMPGDPEALVVSDAGYDAPRIAHLLHDLPVEILGRLRSDRVMRPSATAEGLRPRVADRPSRAASSSSVTSPPGALSRPSRSPTPASTARRTRKPGTGCTRG